MIEFKTHDYWCKKCQCFYSNQSINYYEHTKYNKKYTKQQINKMLK